MATNNQTSEIAKGSLAQLTRPFDSRITHAPSGKIYVQKGFPTGSRWVEVTGDGGDTTIKNLNDIGDVSADNPVAGDTLVYNDILKLWEATQVDLEVPVGKSAFVSQTTGNDATAEIGRFDKMFQTLSAAKAAAAPSMVTAVSHQFGTGSGYPFGPQTNIPVSGGTGVGLTVDYEVVGFFTIVTINNPGSGYTNGDFVTVTGGNNDMLVNVVVSAEETAIYVFGDANQTVNLAKNGIVSYTFLGGGVISGFADCFSDEGGTVDIPVVRGDATFKNLSNGRKFLDITGIGTKYDIECKEIEQAAGFSVFNWRGGTDDSRLVVTGDMFNSAFNNYVIRIEGPAKGTVTVGNDITCSFLGSGIGGPIFMTGVVDTFPVIKAKAVRSLTPNAPNCTVQSLATGTGRVDIYADIHGNDNPLIKFFWGNSVCRYSSLDMKIFGDIYTSTRPAHSFYTAGGKIEHIGNLYTSFPGNSFQIEAGSFDFSMKGDIYSTASTGPCVTKQTGGKFKHDGEVHNTFIPAGLGSVASTTVTVIGSGYPFQTTTNGVTTTAITGVGTGLTLYAQSLSTLGNVNLTMVDDSGSGYAVGDIVELTGEGDGNARVVIDHVGVSGIVLSANAGYDAVFRNTLIVIAAALGDESGLSAFTTNKDIKVTGQVASNKPNNLVTNLVTGSVGIYDDPQIE